MARMRLETLGLRAASRKPAVAGWARVGWKLIRGHASSFVVWALKGYGGRPAARRPARRTRLWAGGLWAAGRPTGWGWPAAAGKPRSPRLRRVSNSDRGKRRKRVNSPDNIPNFILSGASRECLFDPSIRHGGLRASWRPVASDQRPVKSDPSCTPLGKPARGRQAPFGSAQGLRFAPTGRAGVLRLTPVPKLREGAREDAALARPLPR